MYTLVKCHFGFYTRFEIIHSLCAVNYCLRLQENTTTSFLLVSIHFYIPAPRRLPEIVSTSLLHPNRNGVNDSRPLACTRSVLARVFRYDPWPGLVQRIKACGRWICKHPLEIKFSSLNTSQLFTSLFPFRTPAPVPTQIVLVHGLCTRTADRSLPAICCDLGRCSTCP